MDLITSKDFSHKNLYGKSFRKQNLKGVNFQGSDIRGVNFEEAILEGANFDHAKTGLQYKYVIIFIIISVISCLLSAIIAGTAGSFLDDALSELFPCRENTCLGIGNQIAVFIIAFTVIFIPVQQGWKGIVVLPLVLAMVFWGLPMSTFLISAETANIINNNIKFAAIRAAWAMGFTLIVVIILSWAMVLIANVVGKWGANCVWFLAVVVAIGVLVYIKSRWESFPYFALALSWAIAVIMIAGYTGRQILTGDERLILIKKNAVMLIAQCGTNFSRADLTEASFARATVRNAYFAKAVLTRTCWLQAEELETAYLENTILAHKTVRNLLVTGNGRETSFAGLNLEGAYLRKADLGHANLNNADLQNAILTKVNFSKAQVLGVNFKGANLTGACLESWNINSDTQLKDVFCDYFFLLSGNQERRPSSGYFNEGDFSKLFQKVLNTIEFIFSYENFKSEDFNKYGIFLESLNKVRIENNCGELDIQGVEKKDDILIIRINAPAEVDKEKIHEEVKLNYEAKIKQIETYYQKFIKEKTKEINWLRNQHTGLVEKLFYQPRGNNTMHINIEGSTLSGSTLNWGEIGRDVSNTIQNLPTSQDPEQPGLKELLSQLQQLLEEANELNSEDKADALQQVKVLAEAGKKPSEERRSVVKTALMFLRGLATQLPTVTKLAEELPKLLSALTALFKV